MYMYLIDASWEVVPQNNLFGGILSVLFSVSLSFPNVVRRYNGKMKF